ncbi:MAG: hypothetical protein EYC62_09725 [Alphaproteobacteria bacterium]|nr:MAG: hypothetical protein EYC62_09725 [Alphaproteobacteria bacterium]
MRHTAGSLQTAIRDSKTGRTDPSTLPWLRKDSRNQGARPRDVKKSENLVSTPVGNALEAVPLQSPDNDLNDGSLTPRTFDGVGFAFLYDSDEASHLPTPDVRELIASVGTGIDTEIKPLSGGVSLPAGPGNVAVHAILSRAGRVY